MKPIRLELQAFQTFNEKTVIDFERLSDKVFLIYGKTGSGKTTLYDATCYALYGEVSGDLRNKEVTTNVRSTYSDNKTVTYVDFTFKIKNDIFRIIRYPGKQPIEKKLTYYKNERVELYKNGIDITKAKLEETDKYIAKEIIKLTRDQFKQTLMISQGDFAALVRADSKERTDIFRTILNTYNLANIAQILKDKALDLERNVKNTKTLLELKIKDLASNLFTEDFYNKKVLIDGNSVYLDEILETVKNTLTENTNIVTKLEEEKVDVAASRDNLNMKLGLVEQNNKRIANYNDYLKSMQLLNNKKEEIDSLRLKLENSTKAKLVDEKNKIYERDNIQYLNNEKNLEKHQQELKELISNEVEIKGKYQLIPKLKDEVTNLSKESYELNNKLQALKTLKALNDDLTTLVNNQAKLNIDYDKVKTEYEALEKLITEAKNYLLENANIDSLLKENDRLIKEQQDKLKLIADIKTKLTTLNGEFTALNKDKEDLKKKNIQYNLDKSDLAGLEQAFYLNQAAILAEHLIPNQPCPVCGSLEHPNKASFTSKIITKEEIDDKKSTLDEFLKEINELKSKVETENSKLVTEQDSLFKRFKEEFSSNYTDETTNNLVNEINNCINSLNKYKEDLLIIDKNYQDYKKLVDNNNLKDLADKKQTLEDRRQDNQSEIDKKTGEIKSLKIELEGYIYSEVEAKLKEIDSSIDSHNKNITTYENNYLEHVKAKESVEGKIKICIQNKDDFLKKLNESKEALNKVENENNLKATEVNIYLLSSNDEKNLNEKIKKYDESITKFNSLIKEEEKNGILNLKFEDTAIISQDLDNMNIRLKEIDSKINEYLILEKNTKNIILKIAEEKKRYNDVSKEYTPYKNLSDVFNGEVSKRKITFETFYQVEFFKDILKAASRRFRNMTGGKYSLVYKEDVSTGSKKSGLDMEVLDNYNGIKRNISSLSGGESFMASLALALSMSDIIQANTGGISLDSMFIDEGFGTLDSEALDLALNQIAELSSNGKMVGLISHVEELKNRIPDQIYVVKSENGSRVITK